MVKVKIQFDKENCIGCGACAAVCPVAIWRLKGDKAEFDKEKVAKGDCTYNLACQTSCPVEAIKVVKIE